MKTLERAWPGGPLRVCGTGNGKPSVYACEGCRARSGGVYRVLHVVSRAETWLCASCKESRTVRKAQPEALRQYEREPRSEMVQC